MKRIASPGKRHNDSYGSQVSRALPLSPILWVMAQKVQHERPLTRKDKYQRKGYSNIRLSDEQVVQLRQEYDRGGMNIQMLAVAHPDWPIPKNKKSAERVIRNIVFWINRRTRNDGTPW